MRLTNKALGVAFQSDDEEARFRAAVARTVEMLKPVRTILGDDWSGRKEAERRLLTMPARLAWQVGEDAEGLEAGHDMYCSRCRSGLPCPTRVVDAAEGATEIDRALAGLLEAAEHDTQAARALHEFAAELAEGGRALPPALGRYMESGAEIPPGRPGRRPDSVRATAVVYAVNAAMEDGFQLYRRFRKAGADEEPDLGPPSAFTVVRAALAELDLHVGETTLEKAWEKSNPALRRPAR